MADESRKCPQSEMLSECEREQLCAWAVKHGFDLRTSKDFELAAHMWRERHPEPARIPHEKQSA